MSDPNGKADKTPKQDQNEGEGSRSAAHHYNDGVKATVESGKVEQKADEARKALDGAEGEELRRAEKEAKERSKS
jgi:hypothetical protein